MTDGRRILTPVTALVFLLAAEIVVFSPLLGYFFSQDDFMLLQAATEKFGAEMAANFGHVAYHFRPLTKVVYFAGAHAVFGMHALPYHIVSLLIHLANTVLVYLLLVRMKISRAAAVVATAFFGMSVAFFHVIAWITCIQQLLPLLFVLLTMVLALDALRLARSSLALLSLVAYVLALLSMEQSLGAPVFVFLIAVLGLADKRYSLGRTLRVLWPHMLLLAVYLAMRFWWKGLPNRGISEFAFRANLLDNLRIYSGALYAFWPPISNLITRTPHAWTRTHYALGAMLLANLIQLRFGAVLFGVSFVLITLAPALPLQGHYFYYHTYASAFGAIYLLALVLDDGFIVFRELRRPSLARQTALSMLLVLLIATFSYRAVRRNERRALDGNPQGASFVLQRAVIADRLYRCLESKRAEWGGLEEVYMVYGRPGSVRTGGSGSRHLQWSTGMGSAFDLFFRQYGIKASVLKSSGPYDKYHNARSRVLFFGEQGVCYTFDEVVTAKPAAPDTTTTPAAPGTPDTPANPPQPGP